MRSHAPFLSSDVANYESRLRQTLAATPKDEFAPPFLRSASRPLWQKTLCRVISRSWTVGG
jgi:hypothetical protein